MKDKTKKPPMVAKSPETRERTKLTAKLTLQPSANAAAVIQEYGKPFGAQELGALVEELATSIEQIQNGDMKQCEAMLTGQAQALQSIFMNLSRRALCQEYQQHFESFFRMALKAQNQCRMTLETLATIKNPPIVYAKQANIAHGPQQVNNGTPPHAREEKAIQSNELLESKQDEQRLDTGTASASGSLDSAMEAMGAVNRTANG